MTGIVDVSSSIGASVDQWGVDPAQLGRIAVEVGQVSRNFRSPIHAVFDQAFDTVFGVRRIESGGSAMLHNAAGGTLSAMDRDVAAGLCKVRLYS